ncbi:glycoside hydrolase family 16 protein [Streptomyces sp. PTM05]|uniref:Glycoside hydrolase family 16 protein n=1 Tax=Streptantibioticus parmotrematis TaxID=2873249 RepID=A0ABS7QYK4_9ACTN|nr:glycoside hydrolase family 16 protein [Streptantibioticus parmotrematis]MBY8888291.1 glycoside hydrolase family 16 protein [Streptantibioticus parmotrematis]
MTVRRARPALRALAACLLAVAAGCGAPAATTPPAPPAPAAPGHWHQVFADDFGGSRLDPAKWTTCYDWNRGGCTNSTNHELQWYLPGQVTVGGGKLTLTAQRRTTKGTDGHTYPWTSGMVSTGRDSWNATPRSTFTYGYFAAAVRIPSQGGMLPAFWLMPASRHTPPELDVAEGLGSTTTVRMTTHWKGHDGTEQSAAGHYGPVDFPAGYHVFALDWEPTSLTWYVDGTPRFRVTSAQQIPHVPMEVLLTLAVGYPSPPPPGVDSAAMSVGWVDVWQH